MQQAKLFLTVYGCCALADSAGFNRNICTSAHWSEVTALLIS
uniref:Uncharacterized protein n=1 Tax=Populus trichocarpa TaxID=3694 RepID=A0A3N7G7Z5_POPTR